MKALFLMLLVLGIGACSTLNTSINKDQNRYKVFVVNQEPSNCNFVGNVTGIGNEPFEGNTRYTIPLAMTDAKRKTAYLGGNVIYINNAYQDGTSYVLQAACFKCETKIVKRGTNKEITRR